VLVNSVLVEYGIWDGFVQAFLARTENSKYRIARYNSRGRYANTGSLPCTVDQLAQDVLSLLDALRVPRAAAVIGVSLGGATTLNLALKHPDRVSTFVACDTNAAAPPGNAQAWDERVAMAETNHATSASGEALVGSSLAEATVRRWFAPTSYDDKVLSSEIERVKSMVARNSLDGFRAGVRALHRYDFGSEMGAGRVPGMFVVGAADGRLPTSMKGMAAEYADGTWPLVVVERAGHLPMVEQPDGFAETVGRFLGAL
jgi:pimeloyl-ACP methyl ester carboxylesterase